MTGRTVPTRRGSGRRARGRGNRRSRARSRTTASCVAASGRWPDDRAQKLDVPAAFGRGQRHRRAHRVLDHLARRRTKQPAERRQIAQPLHEARDAQVQDLGGLLAAQVGRLAGVDVEVRPAFDVAIEQRAGSVERRLGVGLAGRQERPAHLVLLGRQGALAFVLCLLALGGQRPDPREARGRAARKAGLGRPRPPNQSR